MELALIAEHQPIGNTKGTEQKYTFSSKNSTIAPVQFQGLSFGTIGCIARDLDINNKIAIGDVSADWDKEVEELINILQERYG